MNIYQYEHIKQQHESTHLAFDGKARAAGDSLRLRKPQRRRRQEEFRQITELKRSRGTHRPAKG